VLVCRRADVVQMVGSEAIKALVYRDAVDIKTLEIRNVVVAIVTAGHANPSLPRRIREYLDENHVRYPATKRRRPQYLSRW
jgi:hypothetical protein